MKYSLRVKSWIFLKEPLILVLAEVAKVKGVLPNNTQGVLPNNTKGVLPDVIWYLPTYVKYAKIMVHVRDHVQRL